MLKNTGGCLRRILKPCFNTTVCCSFDFQGPFKITWKKGKISLESKKGMKTIFCAFFIKKFFLVMCPNSLLCISRVFFFFISETAFFPIVRFYLYKCLFFKYFFHYYLSPLYSLPPVPPYTPTSQFRFASL